MFFFRGNNFSKTQLKIALLLLFVIVDVIALPTSNIPQGSDGGYKAPCFPSQVSTVNIANITLPSGETISSEFLSNNFNPIPHGQIILANCEGENYVFGEVEGANARRSMRTLDYNPTKSYPLACNNGALLKQKSIHYCDKKCNAYPLKTLGYTVPQEIISPGITTTITCPTDKTTRNGATFQLTCKENGILETSSGACFPKKNACTLPSSQPPILLQEGTMLNCPGKYGLTKLSCIAGIWEGRKNGEEVLCDDKCLSNCKESLGDVVFNYETIQEAIINVLDNVNLSIEELVNFCEANPDDEGCAVSLPICDYKGVQYNFGTTITLDCASEKDTKAKFQCFDGWVFMSFLEAETDAFSNFSLAKCGTNSPVIEVEEAGSVNGRNNVKDKMTLKDYRMQKLKMTQSNSN